MILESNQMFTLKKESNPSLQQVQLNDVTLAYVNSGHTLFCVDDNEFILSSHHAFILNPSNTISIKNADTAILNELYLLHLNTYEVQSFLEKPFAHFSNLEKHESQEWHIVCQEIEKVIAFYQGGHDTSFHKLHQHSFFCSLLKALTPFLLTAQDSVFKDAPPIMNEVFWYIQHHYTEHLTLQELAQKFYVSDSSLSRWIKQYYGMHFEKYIRKLRASHCALEISNTDKSMIEIALKYGFSNPAALNKAFHEFYHMTPGEYRKNHQPHWARGTVYRSSERD